MSYPVRPWRGRGGGRRDPFAALDAMQERMSRMFGETLTGFRGRTPMWHPDLDVDETADAWMVEIRLPGVAPDEVTVDVTDRELVVRSRHEESSDSDASAESEIEQAPGASRSRRSSSFLYRLSLPSEVDTEKIDATMDHGLLTITLPKSTQSSSRSISIGRRGKSIEGQVTGQSAGSATADSVRAEGQQGETERAEAAQPSTGVDYTNPAGASQGGTSQAEAPAAGES
jgi:HSP20 family protein